MAAVTFQCCGKIKDIRRVTDQEASRFLEQTGGIGPYTMPYPECDDCAESAWPEGQYGEDFDSDDDAPWRP
jgi:hypothetical protein